MIEQQFKTEILISGAGPSGLMMACQLAVHNIPFRIIDKRLKRENYSGAMILHSRSLEILHQMGISLRFLKEGVIARRINFQFNYRNSFSADVADFGNGWSLFPYIFILEQSKIEQLLMSFIQEKGYSIESGITLASFTQKQGRVTSVLTKHDGAEEVLTTRFLIGAGGSSSVVRQQLNIPFYGITHPELLFVSDSQADLPSPRSEMLFSFTKNQSLGFFPLSNNRWRIDGAIPNLGQNGEEVNFESIGNHLNTDRNLNLQLINSSWFSVFRSHSRYAPVTRHHHCFLVGDAAHIHSPVGAQGMNTGLQDAYNLSWKLAYYIKGFARPAILDTYQEERLPVAKNIIQYTDKFYLWITGTKPLFKYIRLYLIPLMLRLLIFLTEKVKVVRKFIFFSISGTGVNYRKSSLSAYFPKTFFDSAPMPGDRLPCFQYFLGSHIYNLQEKITYKTFKLLIFGVNGIPANIQAVVSKFSNILEAEVIPVNPGTEEIYQAMVKHNYACYLVRPDMYIAWRSDTLDARHLELYLRKFFVPEYALQEA